MRLADLVAGLSRLADLGFGLEAGESLRSAALAAMVGRSLDLPDEDVSAALYTALLRHVGCVGYAHETVRTFGEEHAVNLAAETTDLAEVRDIASNLVPTLLRATDAKGRVRVGVAALRGRRFGRAFDTASCEVARDAARRLGLSKRVQDSIYHSAEWWNGRGAPGGLAGEDIPVGARLAAAASIAALFDTIGGPEAASEAVRGRRGGMLDPSVAAHVADHFAAMARDLDANDPYEVVLDAEPRPVASVLEPRLVDVATVFGDLGDVKVPHTYGHARGVAALAREAARSLGLPDGAVRDLELAALLHDVGRVAVSNQIWERPGSLRRHEWEQVRLHAYHSERIVSASQRLAPLAPLIGAHHERGDGSGYHRGLVGTALPEAARILAVADAYDAMTHARPHRDALTPERTERELRDAARTGRLDPDAVTAVLAVAGHDVRLPVRRELPANLTQREVEVLRLVAEGCTNAHIAGRLVISRRTAEDHVQRIYRKTGASNRAAAAMFAMEHGLLER